MSVITKVLKQFAVYWPPSTPDEYGKRTYGTPVEIQCRWDDVAEEFVDQEGSTVLSSAVIMADRDLSLDGVLLLGELASNIDQDDPFNNTGAMPIRRFEKSPNFKCTEFVRQAFL